jgi:sugar lactone lactonase YvrE
MKYQRNIIFYIVSCLFLLFIGLMSASITHAENYTFVTKFGDGELFRPQDVAVDSSGNVYVADSWNGYIQKFSSDGTFITKWYYYSRNDLFEFYPRGVAVDSTGNVYVTDMKNAHILKFSSNGTFLTKWGSFGSINGQFSTPMGIAVDSSGNVYVADLNHHRIQKYSGDGTFLKNMGVFGPLIEYPEGVAVDSSGNVYVADTQNNRIQKFDSDGKFLTQWGSYGIDNGQFYHQEDIAVDSLGNVYVADCLNNRIQKFSSDGTFLTKWGSFGGGDGNFAIPEGVGVDSSGNVYVADTQNNRIQMFSKEKSTFTITWDTPADINYGTALSSTQLNAAASVSGTFTYTPASGTVLNAGTQTLYVDFTPTDTTNYDTASASVQINVLTSVQGIQQIINMVQNLNLNQDQANSLIVKLNTVTHNLNNGNTVSATNELGAFINEVEAYIKSGKLSSTEGQALIDAADAIKNALNPQTTSVPEFPSIALPVAACLGLVLILGRKKND